MPLAAAAGAAPFDPPAWPGSSLRGARRRSHLRHVDAALRSPFSNRRPPKQLSKRLV